MNFLAITAEHVAATDTRRVGPSFQGALELVTIRTNQLDYHSGWAAAEKHVDTDFRNRASVAFWRSGRVEHFCHHILQRLRVLGVAV